jgi:hypothetical protein
MVDSHVAADTEGERVSRNHNIVQFHPLLAVAVLTRKALIGRDRKPSDRLSAGGQTPKLGINFCPVPLLRQGALVLKNRTFLSRSASSQN